MARKPLEDYDRKRDFGRTPEPAPAPPVRRAGEPIFVVHRHEARRLHYDLRLERGGVLCSWAVPKGFSYDPADKHLAIRTEDHPLEYERFHGVIPKGEYGAGTMTIWDAGRYELLNAGNGGRGDPIADPIERGDVKLVLRGRRLRGEWHLVKTTGGPNHWLLFKSRDRYVGGGGGDSALGIDLRSAPETPPPRSIRRMEAGERCAPFSEAGWIFEARFEGLRVTAVKQGESVRLRGLRRRLPALEEDLRAIRAENAILDGVLVAMDDEQRPSRELLERRLDAGDEDAVVLYAFDLLYYEDYDLRSLPQLDRKAGLRALLPPLAHVAFMDHVPGNGEALVEAVAAAGLTGVIAKRADAPYRAGPSADWREIDVASPSASSGVTVTDALARSARSRRSLGSGPGRSARSRVKLSNLEKVYWPADGFTKGDLLAYYEHVADVLLPYLEDRPVHLNRFPDGIDGKSFYQKEAKDGTPGWIRTVELASRHREGGLLEYMVCGDRDTLLYLVNLGSIDLHPWMSRVSSPDEPDYAVIDLDPKGAPFAHVVRIAREVGRVLRGIGMRPLLKTSGKTGLHVVLPLEPGTTYEQSALFCEGVARVVTRDLRDIATVERALSSREGKVYVDFGQNRKGQTIVPPYVVRPVRGATVSAPLAWDELDTDLSPSLFTIQTMPERLARLGDLFRPLFTDRQSLGDAAEALEQYLRKR